MILKILPRSISYLLLNEITERYSLYGMRSILIAFMINYLYFSESHSLFIFHTFIVLCYLFAILGGIIGDKYWDKKYQLLIFLSILYVGGHIILSCFVTKYGMYTGLIIIAFCTGLIKPIIVSFVGDQFVLPEEQTQYGIAMNLCFFAVNIGSTLAMLIAPYLLQHYGAGIAFFVPSCAMFLSLLFVISGKKYYRVQHEKISLQYSYDKSYNLSKIGVIAGIFLALSVFFMLFDQMFSVVVLQAGLMNCDIFGYKIIPSQIPIINPFLIIIISPLFNYIYKILDSRGYNIKISSKIKIGMVIASLSFIILMVIEHFINLGYILSIKWQILSFIFITFAEILIMPSSAEFAYSVAPHWAKCRSISFFFLSICIGNIFSILVFSVSQVKYFIFTVSSIFVIASFIALSIFFSIYEKTKNLKVDV